MQLLELNSEQIKAVQSGPGPVLVLAGAGAGKTRVLTHRVAHLLEQEHIKASRILVVTFTNKAAREMKERLANLVGERQTEQLWVGTFHSICARLLRQEISRIGYTSRYAIYDTDDQTKVMKTVLSELDLDPTKYRPRDLLRQISKLKNQGLLPADYRQQDLDFEELSLARIFEAYQHKLALFNALDFDDLLLQTLVLLRRFPDILQRYQYHFQYLLVDEYQDTNTVQFEMIRLLAAPQNNVFVVGDVDQSIYSFRNADFQIILRFQEDYSGALIYKLEENYRSTRPILAAANTLIDYNRDRFDKSLRSVRGDGDELKLFTARNEYQEADYILSKIKYIYATGKYDYGDICILYRTNAQSRLFEERLVQQNIPHQVLGSFRFYERKEIKDLTAYLAVIFNPLDALNLKRIINTPKRGIGIKSIQLLEQAAERSDLSLWDALNSPDILATLPKRLHEKLNHFATWLKTLQAQNATLPVLIEQIYQDSGYKDELAKDEETFEDRESYVYSFIQAARDFQPSDSEDLLAEFLQHLALISDLDNLQESGRLLRLMTVHAAKGLEFPVVFVSGLEERIFPHSRSIEAEESGDDAPIEEERRLMYVAMTRAQDLLFLTHASQRNLRGESYYQEPSRFLEEIEEHLPESLNLSSPLDSLEASNGHAETEQGHSLENDSIEAGELVFHPDFGTGLVEKIYSAGSREIVIVAFQNGFGKRILDLRSAPLEKA